MWEGVATEAPVWTGTGTGDAACCCGGGDGLGMGLKEFWGGGFGLVWLLSLSVSSSNRFSGSCEKSFSGSSCVDGGGEGVGSCDTSSTCGTGWTGVSTAD